MAAFYQWRCDKTLATRTRSRSCVRENRQWDRKRRTRDTIVSLSPNLFFSSVEKMDARGISKVLKVVPRPKLSIGLFASARFLFCWMKADLARRIKIEKEPAANILKKKGDIICESFVLYAIYRFILPFYLHALGKCFFFTLFIAFRTLEFCFKISTVLCNYTTNIDYYLRLQFRYYDIIQYFILR